VQPPPREHVCVIVTAPNIAAARKIASTALTARLVACANIAPKIESHYWWQGQIESSSEVMIFFKTRNDKLRELEACVLKNHPYQTPEFVVLKISAGNEKYLAWIDQSVQAPE
jgi:periplasmic divalent cation tolerance protein